jgi:PadR family transcriptional regulator, regulatory protein PadR
LKSLEHNRAVTGITEGVATEILVNKSVVGAVAGTAVRSQLLLSTVTGHLPTNDHQIGLGALTMRQVGAHVGSLVHVAVTLPSGKRRSATFQVVSQVSFPVLGGSVSLGTGAIITTAGYENTLCPAGPQRPTCISGALATSNGGGMLVRVVSGPLGRAAVSHYLNAYRSTTALAITPTFCLLAVMGEGPAYGYEMTKRLRARGLSIVGEGSIYPLLGRLERDGLVETRRAASNGGPPRKYYSLSPEGERVLEEGKTEWQATRDAVDGALGLVKAEVMP